jgi:hypothetical protein
MENLEFKIELCVTNMELEAEKYFLLSRIKGSKRWFYTSLSYKTVIPKKHGINNHYIAPLLNEVQMYCNEYTVNTTVDVKGKINNFKHSNDKEKSLFKTFINFVLELINYNRNKQ